MAGFGLPLLNPDNRAYWTGGADGELRVPRCESCGRYQHPSMVVCPRCRGRLAATTVSGLGTVVGFTVNSQAWLPDAPREYTIALVAIDEEPAVRLMGNVTGESEPVVGSRVRVDFVQMDDVWLPQWVLTGEPPAPIRVDEPVVSVRPMARAGKFEERVAVTGLGMSEIGRRLMRPPISLATEAAIAAVAEAGLSMDDIDGLSTYPGNFHVRGLGEGGVAPLEEALRLRPTWINGGVDLPGPTGAVVAGMLAIAAGLCRHVLCIRTVWEATAAEEVRSGQVRLEAPARMTGDIQWAVPYGAVSAAHWIGIYASQYFAKYGADRRLLARIALNARANAARTPWAIYREPITLDDYFAARMITTPFGLLDCDVPCDASIAIVVSAADVAPDLAKRPVYVEAVGTQITERQSWDQGTLTHEPNVFGPAAHLWTRTSLRQDDVDLACLYDGFSFNCVSWLEGLGFCGLGEAQEYLGDGSRIALDGELPVNPHGGQLSAGRTHGFGFLHEAVTQLRGEAGDRQVNDARVAVVSTGGGSPGGAFLLRRDA